MRRGRTLGDEVLRHSPLESERFGISIGRAVVTDPVGALPALLENFSTSTYDFVVLRLPAGSHDLINALRSRGLEAVHADTLVYYECDLGRGFVDTPNHEPSQIRYDLAKPDDIDAIAAIATASFADYRSHYHAAPEFGRDEILAGYVEWAEGFLRHPVPGSSIYVARSAEDEVVGFYGCNTQADGDAQSIEVVLNAILPRHQGAGVYRKGLSAIMRDARGNGVGRMRISTQVWNYRVQKAWAACGMHLTRAYDTYHLRPNTRS